MKSTSSFEINLLRGFLLCVSIMCFGSAFSSYLTERRIIAEHKAFIAPADSTEGIVIEMVRKESRSSPPRRSITHAPVIQYEDGSGSTLTFESRTSDSPAKYKVGDSVDILYQPGWAEIASEANSYRDGIVFTEIIFFVGAGLIPLSSSLLVGFIADRYKRA